MGKIELEVKLRKSEMDYSLKATLYLYGVSFTPCSDCPFKNEKPPISICEKTEKCFQRCPFEIMVWILSSRQRKIYEKFRPPALKKRDFEQAINLGKIVQVSPV